MIRSRVGVRVQAAGAERVSRQWARGSVAMDIRCSTAQFSDMWKQEEPVIVDMRSEHSLPEMPGARSA